MLVFKRCFATCSSFRRLHITTKFTNGTLIRTVRDQMMHVPQRNFATQGFLHQLHCISQPEKVNRKDIRTNSEPRCLLCPPRVLPEFDIPASEKSHRRHDFASPLLHVWSLGAGGLLGQRPENTGGSRISFSLLTFAQNWQILAAGHCLVVKTIKSLR